jgi:hypothetical protein
MRQVVGMGEEKRLRKFRVTVCGRSSLVKHRAKCGFQKGVPVGLARREGPLQTTWGEGY